MSKSKLIYNKHVFLTSNEQRTSRTPAYRPLAYRPLHTRPSTCARVRSYLAERERERKRERERERERALLGRLDQIPSYPHAACLNPTTSSVGSEWTRAGVRDASTLFTSSSPAPHRVFQSLFSICNSHCFPVTIAISYPQLTLFSSHYFLSATHAACLYPAAKHTSSSITSSSSSTPRLLANILHIASL